MSNVGLDQKIEGVLFYKATPVKKSALLKLLACTQDELTQAMTRLKERLRQGGTTLLEVNDEIELVTIPELDQLIDSLRKDDLKRDIGKAGAETLAIILYRGPIARSEIDRIRGVNSAFILRNLTVRGLVEKDTGQRTIRYRVTPDLLVHLGISNTTELPDYVPIMDALDAYEKTVTEAEQT